LLDNALKQKMVQERDDYIQMQAAEIQALRDQLSRRVLRTVVENEHIRDTIRQEISLARLQVEDLRRSLFDRIDYAVLSFHKPSFNGALRSLQDEVTRSQQLVQQHADKLREVTCTMCPVDPFNLPRDELSMHTNFPLLYRKQLQQLGKEQLLNMLDIVSFEEGVVQCVGRSLAANQGYFKPGAETVDSLSAD